MDTGKTTNGELDFGDDYYTVTDEEGNEYELEHLDTLELDGNTYMAFVEAGEIDEPEMIIFKVVEENGEELFASIEDDDELERVYGAFMERWVEDDD
jgi:predicted transcriptional regulator YdeE